MKLGLCHINLSGPVFFETRCITLYTSLETGLQRTWQTNSQAKFDMYVTTM